MKKTLLTLLVIVIALTSKASHYSGAELRYEYNGTNYTIILEVYKACAPSSAGLGTTERVIMSSSSLNIQNVMKTLYAVKIDTISLPCHDTSSCHVPTSSYPGYIRHTYMDTVNLLNTPAPDWKLHFSTAARSQSSNVSSQSGNIYVEAKLNNLNGHNSSAYIPNKMPVYLQRTSGGVTLPLQTIDPDGDSIAYEIVAPKETAIGNVSYTNTTYSATAPFGTDGVFGIDASNQTMTLKSNNQGRYALAFLVKEYRNGNLIGSFFRDFNVHVFANNKPVTVPYMSSNSFASVYTCPSAQDTSVVWFADPTFTDTVSIEVITPTMPGWSFASSTTTGSPAASATVSWTAPGNLDPTTLPFFYIKYRVWDQNCPNAVADYAIMVKTRACNADSVWPGDANADKIVNLLDPLTIALTFDHVGDSRINASNNWIAQAGPDWGRNIPLVPVNEKHADCDGNGKVGFTDLVAVGLNYAKTHQKIGAANKITGAPEVFFDLTGIKLTPGASIDLPIKVGSSINAVKDLYGIASRIKISETPPITQMTISSTTSWLGNSTNTLTFSKDITPAVVDWAHARIDHVNANGDGIVAMLSFVIPTNAKPGDTVRFSFENTMLIDKGGNPITQFNAVNTYGMIELPATINKGYSSLQNILIVPNPSENTAHLYVQLAEQQELAISIVDVTGKLIWSERRMADKGSTQIELPATQVASGVYFVNVQAANGISQKMKWMKR